MITKNVHPAQLHHHGQFLLFHLYLLHYRRHHQLCYYQLIKFFNKCISRQFVKTELGSDVSPKKSNKFYGREKCREKSNTHLLRSLKQTSILFDLSFEQSDIYRNFLLRIVVGTVVQCFDAKTKIKTISSSHK